MLCQGKINVSKMSGKCQGILNIQFVPNGEKQKVTWAVFLTFLI